MNGRFVKLLVGAALSSVALFGGTVYVGYIGGSDAKYSADISSSVLTPTTLNSATAVNVICDDDSNTISANEVWQATETSLQTVVQDNSGGKTTATVLYASQTASTSLYEEAAYLAWIAPSFTSNSSYATAIQDAIWYLFDGGSTAKHPLTDTSQPTNENGSTYWYNLAVSSYDDYNNVSGASWYNSLTSPQQKSILFLDPVSGTQSSGGFPQEFIYITSSTPEPATFALFGTGLILLSLGTFRRRAKKSN